MEVVYYAACSLDGYIATPEGGVEWLEPFQGGGEDYGFADFNRSVDALLMGSRTYEFALAHPPWPAADKRSRVFTRRSLPLAHSSVTLTAEGPAAVVAALAAEGFERAWLMGGAALAGSFEKEGLITHYQISVMPVVLGEGIPLFTGACGPHRLKLIEAKPFPNGVVQLRYEAEPLRS